ncbi:MAG: DnaJ domain-containing protein [Leptospiraceae bacterium]|nr:DnaJ domain-containing protein [Leptospiraceae bacterium]MCP5500726.1 DnaJ domain-containing protein [Leptospiraceae bacterium]
MEAFTVSLEEPYVQNILEILENFPEGLSEFELLKSLENKNSLFSGYSLQDELELFQSHFLLFHILYHLDEILKEKKGLGIEIHCLKIKLYTIRQQQRDSSELEKHDPLREYYKDLNHLRNTGRKEVNELLNSFWKKYLAFQKKEEALEVLDLHPAASEEEIKNRYRKLVKEHHPDKGGDSERIIEINKAMEILKS